MIIWILTIAIVVMLASSVVTVGLLVFFEHRNRMAEIKRLEMELEWLETRHTTNGK